MKIIFPALKPFLKRHYILLALFFLPHVVYCRLFFISLGNDFDSQLILLLRFSHYLREKILPLWSPYYFGGMPHVYETATSGAYSPLNWPFLLFTFISGPNTHANYLFFMHIKLLLLGVMAASCYLYLKKISGSTYGSVLGTLIFVFNFRVLDDFRYGTPIDVICFLPILMLLIERIARGEGRFNQAGCSLAFGVMLLSGRPQHALYILIFAIVYFCLRMIQTRSRTEYALALLKLVGMLSLGLMLAAPLLIPLYFDALPELFQRSKGDLAWTEQYRMTFMTLLMNLGFPWFADVHGNFYSSCSTWIMLFIAPYLMYKKKLSRQNANLLVFFLTTFAICVLYSLGSKFGVSKLVMFLIPVLKFTRVHGRIMIIGMFALAAVIALVVGRLEKEKAGPVPLKRICGLYVILSFAPLFFLGALSPGRLSVYAPVNIHHGSLLFPSQLILFIFFSLATTTALFLLLRSDFKSRKIKVFVVMLMLVEAFVYQSQGTWYDSNGTWNDPRFRLTHEEFKNLDSYHYRVSPYAPMWTLNPLLTKEGVQQINQDAPQRVGKFLLYGGGSAAKLYFDLKQGKLFFTPNYAVVESVQQFFESLSGPVYLREVAIIEERDAAFLKAKKYAGSRLSGISEPAIFHIKAYTPNRIEYQVQVPADGFVTHLDNYHPAWKIFVDGYKARLLPTYGAFQGLWLEKGTHQVVMRYDPWSYCVAISLSGIGLGLILIMIFIQPSAAYIRKKRGHLKSRHDSAG